MFATLANGGTEAGKTDEGIHLHANAEQERQSEIRSAESPD